MFRVSPFAPVCASRVLCFLPLIPERARLSTSNPNHLRVLRPGVPALERGVHLIKTLMHEQLFISNLQDTTSAASGPSSPSPPSSARASTRRTGTERHRVLRAESQRSSANSSPIDPIEELRHASTILVNRVFVYIDQAAEATRLGDSQTEAERSGQKPAP